jgi:hypothetical protein
VGWDGGGDGQRLHDGVSIAGRRARLLCHALPPAHDIRHYHTSTAPLPLVSAPYLASHRSSDALIGGGFTFQNPNAVDSCGCGKSFGV